jgi:hypothetical protein
MLNRVCALDLLVPYKTVQPEIRCGSHLGESDSGLFAICPPYVGQFNRQRLVLIGEQQA